MSDTQISNRPIHFTLNCTSEDEVLTELPNLLKNVNVPNNSKIIFTNLNYVISFYIPNWDKSKISNKTTFTYNNTNDTSKLQDANKLHFYELIELVKNKYQKYDLRFTSPSDYNQFFKKQDGVSGPTMLMQYILRNINVYSSIKNQKPESIDSKEWISLMVSYIETHFDDYKQDLTVSEASLASIFF